MTTAAGPRPVQPRFTRDEYECRQQAACAAMAAAGLDGMLLFKQESMYWLTGYDTFGFCFFQSLVLRADGRMALLTRAPDLRQAQHTSVIEDIRIWTDAEGANPALELRSLVEELGLAGKRLGVEYETHGLTAANGRRLEAALDGVAALQDASLLLSRLRLVKSEAELACVREAARLADLALDAAIETTAPGADEAAILAAMQGAVLAAGGDYPGNPFIIGSGPNALLCRYYSGRRHLDPVDQLTLEFAGVSAQYHACLMRTLLVGKVTDRHRELFDAARDALLACEERLRPGCTMGEVFAAHAETFDRRGLSEHRLNACGYSLGAVYAPSWMDWPMFYAGNPVVIEPSMVFFLHMILMDSRRGTAMCLGRTSIVGERGAEPLSKTPLEIILR
jgi:Xaa-Pro dipeptidase